MNPLEINLSTEKYGYHPHNQLHLQIKFQLPTFCGFRATVLTKTAMSQSPNHVRTSAMLRNTTQSWCTEQDKPTLSQTPVAAAAH